MRKLVWFVVLALLPGMAVAADSTNDKQKNSFKHSFKRADTNHDGQLSMAEAEKNAPAVALRFALMDANHDGQLSEKELLGFVNAQRKRALDRFKKADKNGNGALSRDEAKAFPGIYKNYDQMDADHNGELTPREIGQYVQNERKLAKTKSSK